MNPYVQKVCPVILRQQSEVSQILAFRHPLAGMQLIKGTLKPGELPDGDALRELAKESGIHQATVVAKIGELDFHDAEQHWNIFLCAPRIPFADEWTCFTADGDGLDFGFFWHPLDKEPDASWHPVYARALAMIRLWNGSRAHDGRARV